MLFRGRQYLISFKKLLLKTKTENSHGVKIYEWRNSTGRMAVQKRVSLQKNISAKNVDAEKAVQGSASLIHWDLLNITHKDVRVLLSVGMMRITNRIRQNSYPEFFFSLEDNSMATRTFDKFTKIWKAVIWV